MQDEDFESSLVRIFQRAVVFRAGGFLEAELLQTAKESNMAYPTIVEVHTLDKLTSKREELIDLLDQEYRSSRDAGDYLGGGEWLASKLHYVAGEQFEEVFANVVAIWSSPTELKTLPAKLSDLVHSIGEYAPNELARSLVAATCIAKRAFRNHQLNMNDLAIRLEQPIAELIAQGNRRPADALQLASSTFDSRREELLSAVRGFCQATAIAAKPASIEVIKKAHELKRWVISAERPILNDLENMLGTAFRKFCESCERRDSREIVKRAPDIQEFAKRILESHDSRKNSVLWSVIVSPCILHANELVDNQVLSTEIDTIPSLKLASDKLKLDLTKCHREMTFSCRLLNKGDGRASNVRAEFASSGLPVEIKIVEPKGHFEVGGQSQQIVTFGVTLKEKMESLTVPLSWHCTNVTGRAHVQTERLTIEQQHIQPDWQGLLNNPPYSINPITKKEHLYGRNAVLQQLLLNAASSTSAFIWGQKRVGKTSLLQVFASELQKNSRNLCLVLRMGEIAPLHEGQIAHRIAQRFLEMVPGLHLALPSEGEFGAGLGSLVPFMERFLHAVGDKKLVVIIDEFDDLNPAFYTGERGRLFVKALRSLSELGIAFFFVGSERMAPIYHQHKMDLNKWVDVHLDCIESREDCKALIVEPVANVIEYQADCVDSIMDYCERNPFYTHLLCAELFKTCLQEERTYVSESDLQHVQQSLTKHLGITSFSHFWDDNPELDEHTKARFSAENCLILSCLGALGGSFEQIDDVVEAQEKLDLGNADRLSSSQIKSVLTRLHSRGILHTSPLGGRTTVIPSVFLNWLREYGEMHLMPRWREYCAKQAEKSESNSEERHSSTVIAKAFPISEEELLDVSQRLEYLGKQKDPLEIKVWLNQFDDDVRIEIAFQLLKRLALKGFISNGAKTVALARLEEILSARRLEIGAKAWNFVRNKKENLCITFLDSEMKSGGATAREFAKRVRPGKEGSANDIKDWMKSHAKQDPLLVVVDDFAGSGKAATDDLRRLMQKLENSSALSAYLDERRILCLFLYAFPEAIEKLNREYRKVQFISANVFDDDVRALDGNAGIFENEGELKYARAMLLQIGRELASQNPLGFDDMGALVCFHNTIPDNTLPIFWSNGTVNGKPWKPLFPRA